MKTFESRWSRLFPWIMGVLFGLSIALLLITVLLLKNLRNSGSFMPEPSREIAAAREDLGGGSALVAARRRVSPAVVSITAYRTQVVYAWSRISNEWFQQHGSRMPRTRTQKYPSFGSGVIVDPDGYIVTNEHVIRSADEIFVTLTDSTEVAASLVGSTPQFDLALLKIEGHRLPYMPLGDSDRLEIGEPVIAIGSPFTYLFNDNQPTVTAGVISALHRDVKLGSDALQIFKNMIQTDAVINPGNSGGPLVAANGEIIGINTFVIYSGTSSNIGMGFAIPSNTARMVLDEIRKYGRFRNVWTGLMITELTPELKQEFGVPFNTGLIVMQIEEGGPGEKAGIRVGDVIVEMNGLTIRDSAQAARAIFGMQVGDDLDMVLWRNGSTISVKLRLVEKADST